MSEDKLRPASPTFRSTPISPAELDVLHEAIAPKEIYQRKREENEGYSFSIIREYSGVDVGTKILYLERAITLPPSSFYKHLDKLDDPTLISDKRTKNFDFIQNLKVINDLFWNSPLSEGQPGALDHFFKSLSRTCTLREYQAEITYLIQQGVSALKSENPKWAQQKKYRLTLEEGMQPSYAWRLALDMPENHLPHLEIFEEDPRWSDSYQDIKDKRSIADIYILSEKYRTT